MKKRILALFVIALVGSLFMVSSASAAYLERTHTVTAVETDDTGQVLITFSLTNGQGTFYKTHVVPAGQEKTMLAVALTAMSTGMNVEALTDFWYPMSDIYSIRLVAN